jgi:hypothetical protein
MLAAATARMTPEETILALLAERATTATICPSEAARRLTAPDGDWRAQMDAVHAAVDSLAEAGTITLSWKGTPIQKRRGPYRIARR